MKLRISPAIFTTVLALLPIRESSAQDKLILLAESNRSYQSQTWFYSGAGNELQEDKIKENRNEGRRITPAARTAKGWFVTMAKNTGIGRQSYHYGKDWPTDWLKEKSDQNYYITAIASSRTKWFIVLSQDTGYTAQVRFGYDARSENAESASSAGSGSGSGSSSGRSRSNDYIETIEYAPNYTGKDNSEYCPVCGKVAPKHVHIKKRY